MSDSSLNGASTAPDPNLPDDWRQWISRTRACARLSVNHRQFDKLVTEGALPAAVRCPDGTQRWNPAIVDAFADELEGKTSNAAELKGEADLGKATAAQVAVSTNHAERLISLLERPMLQAMRELRQVNNDLRDELERTRERLHIVEQARTDLITAREALLSEQAARDIAARESAAKDARRKQMIDIFVSRAPGVLDAVTKTLGISSQDQVKVKAVIDLANELDPAVLEMLASSGALTPKQVELVETIIGKKIRTAQAEEAKGDDGKNA